MSEDEDVLYKLEFTRTEGQFLEYVAATQKGVYGTPRLMVLSILPLVGAVTGGILAFMLDGGNLPDLGIFSLAGFFGGVGFHYASALSQEKFQPALLDEDGVTLAPTKLLLSNRTFSESILNGQSWYNWVLVKRLQICENCMILILGRLEGVIIPNDAFESEEQRSEITNFIESKIGAAS